MKAAREGRRGWGGVPPGCHQVPSGACEEGGVPRERGPPFCTHNHQGVGFGYNQANGLAVVTPLGGPRDPQGQVGDHHGMGIWAPTEPAKGDTFVWSWGPVGTGWWLPWCGICVGHGSHLWVALRTLRDKLVATM